MYEDVDAILDALIERTAQALKAMAGRDIPPGQALSMLIGAHIGAANVHNQADTAAGYAVALYRLVADRAHIAKLEDKIAMLQALDEIREM